MTPLTLAANNGSIGGGEVMLLQMAEAARDLGVPVTVVGPGSPSGLVEAAASAGFDTVVLPASGRPAYLRRLRAWDRHNRSGYLWCTGLVPALATAGHPRRVVHLHQAPKRLQSLAALAARWRSDRVIVPSRFMASQVRDSMTMTNWTARPLPSARHQLDRGPARVGFLGRLSQDKGVDVLAQAVRLLEQRSPGSVRLVLAGDYRFVSEDQASAVRRALSEIVGLVVELGWVEHREFFDNVDLAVFPSVWAEPFGLVVAEAMAARVPFVVSDAGALPEVVGPDHPWVAARGDPLHLADVIESALGEEVSAVTLAAHARWEAEYSPQAGSRRFAAVLRDLGILDESPRTKP
jgi:glycosyltransferase involved in cell wall biosynthesis